MPHTLSLPHTTKKEAQARIDRKAMEVGAAVKAMKRRKKKPPEKKLFALEDKVFFPDAPEAGQEVLGQ